MKGGCENSQFLCRTVLRCCAVVKHSSLQRTVFLFCCAFFAAADVCANRATGKPGCAARTKAAEACRWLGEASDVRQTCNLSQSLRRLNPAFKYNLSSCAMMWGAAEWKRCGTVMTRMQSMDALESGSADACVKRELARTRMSLTCSLKDRPFRQAWVSRNAEPRPPC